MKLSDPWSAEKGAHNLTVDTIRDVKEHFNYLEPAVKARVLLSLLSVKRHQATQIKEGMAQLLERAVLDDDPWVQMIAGALASYPEDASLQLHPAHAASESLLEAVASKVAEAADANPSKADVPALEALYLDPSVAPSLKTAHEHFVLRAAAPVEDPYDQQEAADTAQQPSPKPSAEGSHTPRAAPKHQAPRPLGMPKMGMGRPAVPVGSKRTMMAIDFEEAIKEGEHAKRRRGEDKAAAKATNEAKPTSSGLEAVQQQVPESWAAPGAGPALTPQIEESIRQAFSGATNQLTPQLRAQISAFLAGDHSRAPLDGITEEVVLNEEDKYVMEEGGTQVLSHRERIIFEMNYETGKWRKLRRKLGRKAGT